MNFWDALEPENGDVLVFGILGVYSPPWEVGFCGVYLPPWDSRGMWKIYGVYFPHGHPPRNALIHIPHGIQSILLDVVPRFAEYTLKSCKCHLPHPPSS